MSLVIFFLLALIAAGAIVYPLLPGRAPAQPAPAVTDGDIERAVRRLRRGHTRRGGALLCPECGRLYQAGDHFCVGCGSALPQGQAVSEDAVCPACGAAIRPGDRFCAKCGHSLGGEEAA